MSDQLPTEGDHEVLQQPVTPEIRGADADALFVAAREAYRRGRPDASGSVYLLLANNDFVRVRRTESQDRPAQSVGVARGIGLFLSGRYDRERHGGAHVAYSVTFAGPSNDAEHITAMVAGMPTSEAMVAQVNSEVYPDDAETTWSQLPNGVLVRDPTARHANIRREQLRGDVAAAALTRAMNLLRDGDPVPIDYLLKLQQQQECSRVYGAEAEWVYDALHPLLLDIHVALPEQLMPGGVWSRDWRILLPDANPDLGITRVFTGSSRENTLDHPQSFCTILMANGLHVSVRTTYVPRSWQVTQCEVSYSRALPDDHGRASTPVRLPPLRRATLHAAIATQLLPLNIDFGKSKTQ